MSTRSASDWSFHCESGAFEMPGTVVCSRGAPLPLSARRAGIALATALMFTPASASAQTSRPLEHASVRLDYFPGAQHAFLYLGREKGWYAQEGIDLEIVPGQGSTVSVKTVGSGEDQFAVADAASGARGWEAGVPIVYVATLLRHTPTVIFSLPAKNIHALGDLCGKRIGVNIKTTSADQYNAMIRSARLPCAIEQVPIGAGGGSKEVLSGIVDAGVAFSYTDALQVKVISGGVNLIPARDYFDYYSLGLITSRKLLADKPDLVNRFVKVSLKSLHYALSHKDEALSAFVKAVPRADIPYESAKFGLFKEEVTFDDPSGDSIGEQTAAQWAASLKVLYDIGVIKTRVSADGKFIPLPR
jgi:NitT/TauT family transport system substrate-binding protein